MRRYLRDWYRFEKMSLNEFFEQQDKHQIAADELLSEALLALSAKIRSQAHTTVIDCVVGRSLRIVLRHNYLSATLVVSAGQDRFQYEFESPSESITAEFQGKDSFGDLVDSLYFGPMLDWVNRIGASPVMLNAAF